MQNVDIRATIPCLGPVKTLVRTDGKKLYILCRTERPKTIGYIREYPLRGKTSRRARRLKGTPFRCGKLVLVSSIFVEKINSTECDAAEDITKSYIVIILVAFSSVFFQKSVKFVNCLL